MLTPQDLVEAHGLIPLADLAYLPNNSNRGDGEAIRQSLEQFGQFDSIVVWRGGVLIGNHRVQEAKALGMDDLAGYDLSAFEMEEAERIAIALASNRTARLGYDDPDDLLIQMQAVQEQSPELFEAAGYDDGDLAAILALSQGVDDSTLDDLAGDGGGADGADDEPEVVEIHLALSPEVAERWHTVWEALPGDGSDHNIPIAALLDLAEES